MYAVLGTVYLVSVRYLTPAAHHPAAPSPAPASLQKVAAAACPSRAHKSPTPDSTNWPLAQSANSAARMIIARINATVSFRIAVPSQIQFGKLFLLQVTPIIRRTQVRLRFIQTTDRITQKGNKLLLRPSPKSFGHVRHHRFGRVINLYHAAADPANGARGVQLKISRDQAGPLPELQLSKRSRTRPSDSSHRNNTNTAETPSNPYSVPSTQYKVQNPANQQTASEKFSALDRFPNELETRSTHCCQLDNQNSTVQPKHIRENTFTP